MLPSDTPTVRRNLQARNGDEPNTVILSDPHRLGGPLKLSRAAFDLVRLLNGERTAAQVIEESRKLFSGEAVPHETLSNLVDGLRQSLFLEGPELRERLHVKVRPPSCIGCYDADPEKARKQLKRVFTAAGGPGMPGEPGCRIATEGRVRAVLAPHMDYARGGVTYGWAFKEIIERSDADLFVIIATSHYSGRRFTLTRQDFSSPFGTVTTDQAFIDRVTAEYGDGLFDDPYAHVAEHSIELEVVLLQYLLEGKRPFRIVPLLTGSLFDCVEDRRAPRLNDEVSRMAAALARAESESGGSVCYIISGDLAHIGPKFDDPDLVDDKQLDHSKRQDDRLLAGLTGADIDAYFNVIAEEEDARRICGLPPTYLTLLATRPTRGKILHYGRYVHPEGFESVSFAGAAFDA